MADITGESLQKSQPLPAELLGDEPGQESEVIIPKSRTDSGAASAQGEALSWMFDSRPTDIPRSRPMSYNAPEFQSMFNMSQRQMGGTRVLSSGDQGQWMTPREFAKRAMPGLESSEEILDRHKVRFSSPTSSDEEPGYSQRETEVDEERMERKEVLVLLRAQLVEQTKITAMMKAQNELTANVANQLRGIFGIMHNIYRTGLIQNESLDRIDVAVEDITSAIYKQWSVQESRDKKSTQEEMGAEARRMGVDTREKEAQAEAQAMRDYEVQEQAVRIAQAADMTRVADMTRGDGIPHLAPGVYFGDTSVNRDMSEAIRRMTADANRRMPHVDEAVESGFESKSKYA